MSILKVLPELCTTGGAQMALDVGLLETADRPIARRYTWAPPALSLGRFQKVGIMPDLPFDVVRRPSGGRAVLHGEAFEWSFAVAFPPETLGDGVRAGLDVAAPYEVVSRAFAETFEELGVTLDGGREAPYERSPLCFASVLRHDILARGEKLVAVAQARQGGRALVHGSMLMCRPPDVLTEAVETLLGEPWVGDGLAGAGQVLVPEILWKGVLERIEAALQRRMT